MDQAKKELKEMQYEEILNKTEEILKNYKKLSDHIVLTEKDKEILKNETEEFQNKQFEIDFMTSMHKNMEEKEEQEDEEEM